MTLKILGLFSGIGGFELGLQRAGFEIAAIGNSVVPQIPELIGKAILETIKATP